MKQQELISPVILRFAPIILVLVALALYANTISHGFVLDDEVVITKNSLVQQGVGGIKEIFSEDSFYGFFNQSGKSGLIAGGRYRPLSIALFAVVHQAAGQSSIAYHLLAVAFYAATCLVLYHTLLYMLQGVTPSNAASASLLATLFFTVHPVHTEVVANIKGLDETLAVLFGLCSLLFALRRVDTNSTVWGILSGIALLLACLSKEHAVSFAAAIPLALVVFRKQSYMSAIKTSLPGILAALCFILLRSIVLSGVNSGAQQSLEYMNNPFLVYVNGVWQPMHIADRVGLLLSSFARYAQLLIAPYPLTHDYYPSTIPALGIGSSSAVMGLLVVIGVVVAAIVGIRKTKPWSVGLFAAIASFGVVSNILFPIGTIMGERFLFMPSVGVSLFLGALIAHIRSARTIAITAVFVVVCALFSGITIDRNSAWASNATLFFTDIRTSTNSAKLNSACGGELLTSALSASASDSTKNYAQQAVRYLDAAIAIHPTYGVAYFNRATCYILLARYEQAVRDARIAMQYNGDRRGSQILLARALRDYGKFQGEQQQNITGALSSLKESWGLNPTDGQTAHLLGIGHGISGNHKEALVWFTKAVEIDPQNPQYLLDAGTAHYLNGDSNKRDQLHKLAEQYK